jgi:hypothetical protein
MNEKVEGQKKVLFRLEKDSEGYPPNDWESLWATELGKNKYAVDNIPFFVRGISLGDKVSTSSHGNELHFEHVDEFSNHSVLRVIVFESSDESELIDQLVQFGCEYEGSHIEGLIAFDLPPTVDYYMVVRYLQRGEDDGKWEYEEASIRHE